MALQVALEIEVAVVMGLGDCFRVLSSRMAHTKDMQQSTKLNTTTEEISIIVFERKEYEESRTCFCKRSSKERTECEKSENN